MADEIKTFEEMVERKGNANRIQYDEKLLNKFQENYNVELTYDGDKLTGTTRISGTCINDGCDGLFTQTFRFLHDKDGAPKMTCQPCSMVEWKDKVKATNLKRRGVEFSFQSQEVKDKSKATNLERRGVEFPLQDIQVQGKMKATNLERRGVEYVSQSQEVKDKSKATNLEKRNVEYPMQSNEVKEKSQITSMNNWGVTNPSQSEIIKQKKIETSLKNWGTEHPMQNPLVAERSLKNAFRKKKFTFKNGKIVCVQGYEDWALDLLEEKGYNEPDIETSRIKVPEIWFMDGDFKIRRYYVDVYIPSANLMIEVKSKYTYEKTLADLEWKRSQSIKCGYGFQVWIFDKKKNLTIIY